MKRLDQDLDALVELLVCPVCRGPVTVEAREVRCSTCARLYPLNDGVPAMLSEQQSRSILSHVHHALLARPRVYERVQRVLSSPDIPKRVAARVRSAGGRTVLDVGAGTGALRPFLPPETRYVWLDNDLVKLAALRSAQNDFAVVADANRLPLADDAVDVVALVDVAHHLPREVLDEALREAARVARRGLVFVDAVLTGRTATRLLWKLDLGRHPKSESELLEAIERHFVIDDVEQFRVYHDYVLCGGHVRV